MKKLLAFAAAAALMVSGSAQAAAVDIVVNGTTGAMTITNNSFAGDVFGVSLVFDPIVTGYSFGPNVNAAFSTVDFSGSVLETGFVLLSAGPVPGNHAALGATVNLGTLALSGLLNDCDAGSCTQVRGDVDNLGPIVLSRAGTEIESSISVVGGIPSAPEPATLVLLGLGLAAVAASRRRA